MPFGAIPLPGNLNVTVFGGFFFFASAAERATTLLTASRAINAASTQRMRAMNRTYDGGRVPGTPKLLVDVPGCRRACLDGWHRLADDGRLAERQLAVARVHEHRVARRELVLQQRQRELVDKLLLDH